MHNYYSALPYIAHLLGINFKYLRKQGQRKLSQYIQTTATQASKAFETEYRLLIKEK